MHSRRQVKRSLLGSRVCAGAGAGAGEGALLPWGLHAVKQENGDAPVGLQHDACAIMPLKRDGESCTDEGNGACGDRLRATAPLTCTLKSSCKSNDHPVLETLRNSKDTQPGNAVLEGADCSPMSRIPDPEKDHTRSVSLLEQKRKVVSSSIDVPHARKSEEEADMDKVTAAMVLTSLSTSPLVRSPPVRVSAEALSGSWKDGGFTPSSYSSGYWSCSIPSDQSNPSTPSPPLSADSVKPFRMPAAPAQPDDAIDEPDGSNLLFDEPIPRKRKNSMKVMFKCLWKNCGKVLGTAAGIQKHIRTMHLGRTCDSECSDGEEDFYYTEIKLNTESVAEGLVGPPPLPRPVLSPPPPPPPDPGRPDGGGKLMTPLSRSAPSALYLIHTDHAYQPSPPHSQTKGCPEQRPLPPTVLSSPPRAAGLLSRKSRGEGKKCRKVYGMENRDMWCTACRWKKACQSKGARVHGEQRPEVPGARAGAEGTKNGEASVYNENMWKGTISGAFSFSAPLRSEKREDAFIHCFLCSFANKNRCPGHSGTFLNQQLRFYTAQHCSRCSSSWEF
ncbi:zinc finger protein 704-like isoform X3 [Scleropages formosus]|uniref:zinc finger protein 704-like isoform X3 n=1 Tax=Scleropages formosus TaxID=113540 RepID=UPI0010FAAC72|nr:zinc finger protein 704-like isoform X3 [Scleropages formosus]